MTETMNIEDVIREKLTGDMQKNVLDFVAFLRANDLPPTWDGTWWCVDYKGENLVLLGIDTGGVEFGVLFSRCNFGDIHLVSDRVKETAWAHVQICGHFESGGARCGCDAQPGLVSILGKEFNACKSPLTFIHPDEETLESMKELILLAKKAMNEGDFKMAEQKPKIVTEQINYGEFFWLGKEYPRNWYQTPGMDVWKDFDNAGGWDMVEMHRSNPSYKCAVINHLIEPAGIYMPGTFVENMTNAPEGFTLRKFPACEYIIITHEWRPNWDMFLVEEAVKELHIPDGYVKHDGGDSQIRLIEIEHNDPEKGSRWENWIPIKRI